ncbi:MAG TPA: hypothetical protein VKU00_12775 [Chthonomonadaceae bacterium]|nr:hypothetical protein [Chthonomonadaceae bacterium]
MAYADFTLSGLTRQFNLTRDEDTILFANVPPAQLDPLFLSRLHEDTDLALKVSTEKARSEFIIAPVLTELRRLVQRRIGLFSGVEFTVDQAQGLAGTCDYIITRSTEQMFVEAPVLMLVEAKNEDMKRGYAQCIAEMIAAQTFNVREGKEIDRVYGVVTTGNLWRFLQLQGMHVNIDGREYHIDNVAEIIGILLQVVMS